MSAAAVGLTPAQRYHLDAFGYVLLEGALTPQEVEQAKAALYRMKADRKLQSKRVHSERRGDHFVRFGNLVEYDPALLRYAVHPNLIPRVEELVGGAVRLEESEAIISRRDPCLTPSMLERRPTLPPCFPRRAPPTWRAFLAVRRLATGRDAFDHFRRSQLELETLNLPVGVLHFAEVLSQVSKWVCQVEQLAGSDRGRDVRYRTPPAQIRTCGFPAYGSHRGCLTAKRTLGQG